MTYTRRQFVKTAGLGTAGLALPTFFSSSAPKARKPNILFMMSDDHAEQAIGCYGSRLIKTPNLDRIANDGIRFRNSFVTNSICAPSRAVLLTGKYSHRNGLRDNRDEFDGSQMTFPKLLQTAGYETFIVGKWHLRTNPTGFTDWQILVGQGQYYNPVFIENGEEKQYTGYTTDITTDKALAVLERRNPDKPFCMILNFNAPHRNWMPNIKHFEAFNDTKLPLPDTFNDDYATRSAAAQADMRINDMYLSYDLKLQRGFYDKETGSGGNLEYAADIENNWQRTYERLTAEQRQAWDAHYNRRNEEFRKANLSGKELLEWKYQTFMKDYLRCVLSIDENVGRVLDYLDQSGLAEDTIVVYTSDQGFYLGEHGWYDKRFMYEESLGMPLVMRYPKAIKARQVSDDMVVNLDFAPTILDFAGVKPPTDMQGESFRAITRGKTPGNWRTAMYYHYYEYPHGWHNVKRHYGIRTARYKLIHFYNDLDAWELYDLKEDPHELHNRYDDPAYADIVKDLKVELVTLQNKYGDSEAMQ